MEKEKLTTLRYDLDFRFSYHKGHKEDTMFAKLIELNELHIYRLKNMLLC